MYFHASLNDSGLGMPEDRIRCSAISHSYWTEHDALLAPFAVHKGSGLTDFHPGKKGRH
ncbi:Uncharacterised protein [Vibrio cholerae]|nr:Uncharacterised protein [Vibrio cholerae]